MMNSSRSIYPIYNKMLFHILGWYQVHFLCISLHFQNPVLFPVLLRICTKESQGTIQNRYLKRLDSFFAQDFAACVEFFLEAFFWFLALVQAFLLRSHGVRAITKSVRTAQKYKCSKRNVWILIFVHVIGKCKFQVHSIDVSTTIPTMCISEKKGQ